MPASTFRRDVTAGLYALAEEFRLANPTLVQRVYPRRPGGFTGNLPAIYVGARNENVLHDSGLRQRTMEPQLVIVVGATGTPEEIQSEIDELVDEFLDYATARPHAVSSNTVTSGREPWTLRDTELAMDDTIYPAVVITLTGTVSLEGRS